MLRLGPPFFQIDGVTVVGDAHDPRQFYYFPNRPHLSIDENNRPAIRFIILKEALDELDENEEDVAGFLVFDVDLSWPDDTLRRIESKLEQELELDDKPRLAPLPYRRGNVQLMFLDRVTTPPPLDDDGEEEPGEDEPPPTPPTDVADPNQPWVPFLKASGVPSLYGDNRAIFNAMLNRKATKLLFGAFEGFMPAGVVYNLEYVGMQRAFNVHVEADWEQVYHFLQEKFSADFIFVTVDTDSIVEELEEKKIIKIEASLEVAGDEAAEVEAQFEEGRGELQDLILEKFFAPAPNPNAAEPMDNTVGDLVQGARRIRNVIQNWPTVGYSRREVDVTEIHRIRADYTVSRAAERLIAPQAHISLFFEDFNITRDQVVTVVDGNDALWNQTKFDAALNADFAGDGIEAVSLDVQYAEELITDFEPDADPDAQWSFLFQTPEERVQRAAWFNPDIGHHFFYRYGVFFQPGAIPGPAVELSSGWQSHDSQLLMISPQNLYRKRELTIAPWAQFPFEAYPQVFATVRYEDPETGWRFEDAALIGKDERMTVAFRTRPDADQGVDFRYRFLREDGTVYETPWERTEEDLVTILDPRPTMSVKLVVGGDRTKISALIVDLKYEDEANGVFETDSKIFTPENINQIQVWKVELKNELKRRYSYSQTLIDVEGNVIVTGFQQAEGPTLTVGATFVKLMEVQPEIIGPSFANNNLERIILKLRYEDAPNGVLVETEQQYVQPGKGSPWRLQLKDAGARDYTYEAIYLLNTGFRKTTGNVASRDNFLLVSSVPPQ